MSKPGWILIIVLLLGVGSAGVYGKTRGIRNNNPGNIRLSADPWLGLATSQNDPDFFQFVSAKYGIRAMFKILINYKRIHSINTIEGIINRWAPSIENDTLSYIKQVERDTGITGGTFINIEDKAALLAITKAMIKHENGINIYSADTYENAYRLL